MNDTNAAAVAIPRSQQLVEHLVQLNLNTLGAHVVSEARIRLLDGLGCGLYGSQMSWGKMTANVAYAERSQGNATVLGRKEPIAPARAALCNGTATHGIELDDLTEGAHVHPGSVVIPAALAAAEDRRATGERLLLGLIAGYEAMVRVGFAIGEAGWGFHVTGVAGPIGGAVAAGVVMQLSSEQLLRAIGIACSCSAGIKSFTQGSGGMVKRIHAGRGAESGVLACLLAEQGFTAPLSAIDGHLGLLEVYGGKEAHPEKLVENLGSDYMVNHIWTKVYPCCGATHTAAQALKALRDEHGFKPEAVEKIRIGINRRAVTLNGAVEAKETMAAQYSLPFVAGVALVGDAKDPRAFEGRALNDPLVCDLARRVELYADPEMEALYPHHQSSKVEVRLKNGTAYSATLLDAHGTPPDPCDEFEIKQKFHRLVSTLLNEESINAVIDVVEHITDLPTVAPLSAALRNGVKAT